LAFSCSQDQIPSAECQALLDFYEHTRQDGDWQHNDGWSSGGEVSQWYGVELRDDHVISLNVPANNLVADTLPESLCDLTQLEVLNLHQNQIKGAIPACLGQLTALKHLVLANNQFSGPIPETLCTLTQLESLRLMSNQLSGAIPTCLGALTQLETLWLHNNQFTGTLPTELCQLNQLESLGLARNLLTGSVPECMGDELNNLQILYLSHNQFEGEIPASFSKLTHLKQLYLDNNKLSGPLPKKFVDMALNSEELIQLHMNGNYFKLDECQPVQQLMLKDGWEETVLGWPDGGFVHSPQVGSVYFDQQCPPLSPTLTIKKIGSGTVSGPNIECDDEQCSGTYLPNEIVELTAQPEPGFDFALWSGDCYGITADTTVIMDAHKSCAVHFIGPPSSICDDVVDVVDEECQALVAFYQKTGGPEWVAEKQAGWLEGSTVGGHWYGVTVVDGHVTELKLAGAHLSGVIPEEVCQFKQLQYLDLGTYTRGNHLIGEIPACLGGLTELRVLTLESNELEGSIPSELGHLTNLIHLNLIDNPFSGTIPETICNLVNLEALRLGVYRQSKDWLRSQLEGEIPSCIGENLVHLKTLSLVRSRLTGEIPTTLCNLTELENLGLYHNFLTGEIPSCLGDLSHLTNLSLSLNKLSGEIPIQLGNLVNLKGLGLSNNKLSGPIPTDICNLSQLEGLYLEYNQLDGTIPTCLGHLTELRTFNSHVNKLTGQIPTEICNLTHLAHLMIGYNLLDGAIPACIGNLSNLIRLHLYRNNLTGSIPDSFANLTRLVVAALGENQLQGPLSDTLINGILNNNNLVQLNLIKNNFNLNECQAIHKLRTRGGWMHYHPSWGSWAGSTGFAHSPQNDNFDFSVDCTSLNFHILNITKTGAGTITGDDINCGDRCIEAYDANTEITLMATPEPGNTFTRWSGDCSGSDASITFILDGDKTCTAEFETTPICEQVTDIPQAECEALEAFYSSSGGPEWNKNQGWLTETTANNWFGVTVEAGHVTKLNPGENNLVGTIPVDICELKHLQVLNLGHYNVKQGNDLTGTIPNCLGSLTTLKELSLASNDLNGAIPLELGNLENLTYLNLLDVPLTTTLPEALCKLTQLEYLAIGTNRNLTGNIPSCIGEKLLNLTTLDFRFASLSGEIPASLCHLNQLKWLHLMGNGLTGTIPTCLGQLDLKGIYLQHNQLTGNIPTELCNLNNILSLSLGANQLTGNIPDCIGNDLLSLQTLHLAQNHFSGQIPESFGNLNQLKQLYLYENELSGPIPEPFAQMVLSNTNLIQLNLDKNQFGFNECPQIQEFIDRGGWTDNIPGWSAGNGGFRHSPQNNGFNYPQDCTAYTLTLNKIGAGTVTSDDNTLNCGDDCQKTYAANTQLLLTATAATDSTFTHWSGDCSGSDAQFKLTLDNDKNCTAHFQQQPEIANLTLTKTGPGRGTLRVIAKNDPARLLCRPDCLEAHRTYTPGEPLTLVAKPVDNFIFTHWSGDCSGTDSRIKFTIDEPKTCTAHFALAPDAVMHALTIQISGNGQVTAPQWHSNNCQQGCTLYYPAEQKLRLKAKAAPLSTFIGWSGDCEGQRQTTPLVMTADKTCSATFQSDFKHVTDDIIDIFYAEAELKNGDLNTHYPRSANEACLKEAFWLSTFALMHTDQHYQIIQNGPTQIHDIDWYTPLAAEYCTRSIKTMSGEYIDIALELKTAANSEELTHIIIYYTDEQPNVDYQPVIFFERGVFALW